MIASVVLELSEGNIVSETKPKPCMIYWNIAVGRVGLEPTTHG